MPIHRLNHAVLYVRDLQTSVRFYCDVLGFQPAMESPLPSAAFLKAPGSNNDHDLGLFEIGAAAANSGAGRQTVGLYHLAWEVDTLEDLAAMEAQLDAAGALGGASDHSTTKALYGRDPDGLEFEISWLVPAALITDKIKADRKFIRPLDLSGEMERFGANTKGGIGISRQ